jgi:dTDP-4-amino-4,6-dideoxygalactose transaminase
MRRIDYAGSVHVMETGLILPCNHGMGDADVDHVCATIDAFLERRHHGA